LVRGTIPKRGSFLAIPFATASIVSSKRRVGIHPQPLAQDVCGVRAGKSARSTRDLEAGADEHAVPSHLPVFVGSTRRASALVQVRRATEHPFEEARMFLEGFEDPFVVERLHHIVYV
jgi:hypothetical protein